LTCVPIHYDLAFETLVLSHSVVHLVLECSGLRLSKLNQTPFNSIYVCVSFQRMT